MMATTQGDPALVSDSYHVVGVNVFQQKAYQPCPADVRPEKPYCILQLREPGKGISPKFLIVLCDIVAPNFIQVIHGRMQSDNTGNIRCPGFETMWRGFPCAFLEIYVQDHFTAAVIRRHAREYFLTAIQNSNARGTAHFVPGKNHEVATEFLHVEWPMPRALGGIHQSRDTGFARASAEFRYGIYRAQRIRDVSEGEELHVPGQPFVQMTHVQQTDIAGNGEKQELGTCTLGQQLPGNNVAVMLHLGEQDFIARLDVF